MFRYRPLTRKPRHDRRTAIAVMAGLRVINTARPLVDENAMAAALKAKVAGYMADVLGEEPPRTAARCCMKNAIHAARRVGAAANAPASPNIVVGNVAAFAKGAPTNVVNG
ncbi:MAG: NAD(P)-dependent oxidoreductase [Christensenellales bacterium]